MVEEVLHILLTKHNPPEHYSTYLKLLQTCIRNDALSQGKRVHSFITQRRFAFATRSTFHNKLIDMYVKCGSLFDAQKMFDNMKERDIVSWNTIISAHGRHGYPDEAVTLFHQMQRTGFQPDRFTLATVFPACAAMGALKQGVDIHHSVTDAGILSDVVVSTALVDMYAKCGSIDKARELFDKMPQRNVISWTAMIAGYAQMGFVEKALETFKQMQLEGVKPSCTTFASVISACAKVGALEQGMDIHQTIKDKEILSDVVVLTSLVDMYAKCGRVDKACELFERISQRNVVSWTAMITGYAQNGFVEKALAAFKNMQLAGVKPNRTTFVTILPVCAKIGALEEGTYIHQSIEDMGILSDTVVATALVDMYSKCGSIEKARDLFEKMPQRNVVSWNAMIAGYTQNGFLEKALEIFKRMHLECVMPDSATFASILPACAKMGALELGMSIHGSLTEGGFLSDIFVGNALVDIYAKCGRTDKACNFFDRMPHKDVISWNTMIAGFLQNGFAEKAIKTFQQMYLAGLKPNSTTFATILPACAKLGALEQGMDIHQSVMENGFLSDITVGNSLIDMYAKCGSIEKARKLFDIMPERDFVSWTAMIARYTQNGLVELAVETFEKMQLAGVKPNSTTVASILLGCAKMGALKQGMDIHQSIKDMDFFSDVIVSTALLEMYAKCGRIDKARELFDIIPQRSVVSWTAMIAGYIQNGFLEEALETFKQMHSALVKPDSTTFASILSACARMGSLEQGMGIHQSMEDKEIFSDVRVANALIDMYAKCGSIEKARVLFDRIPTRDVVSWNVMNAGYAQNGLVEMSLETFK